jgi:hypothetical protein
MATSEFPAKGGAPYVTYGVRTVCVAYGVAYGVRSVCRATYGPARRTDRPTYGAGARGVSWLLITDDPHSETGIPEGSGALHRNTGIPEGLVSEIKANFPANRKNN